MRRGDLPGRHAARRQPRLGSHPALQTRAHHGARGIERGVFQRRAGACSVTCSSGRRSCSALPHREAATRDDTREGSRGAQRLRCPQPRAGPRGARASGAALPAGRSAADTASSASTASGPLAATSTSSAVLHAQRHQRHGAARVRVPPVRTHAHVGGEVLERGGEQCRRPRVDAVLEVHGADCGSARPRRPAGAPPPTRGVPAASSMRNSPTATSRPTVLRTTRQPPSAETMTGVSSALRPARHQIQIEAQQLVAGAYVRARRHQQLKALARKGDAVDTDVQQDLAALAGAQRERVARRGDDRELRRRRARAASRRSDRSPHRRRACARRRPRRAPHRAGCSSRQAAPRARSRRRSWGDLQPVDRPHRIERALRELEAQIVHARQCAAAPPPAGP